MILKCQDVKCGREFDMPTARLQKATDGQHWAPCTRCGNIAIDPTYKTREQLKADIVGLDETVGQLEADIEQLEGTVGQLEADILELEGTIEQLEAYILELEEAAQEPTDPEEPEEPTDP